MNKLVSVLAALILASGLSGCSDEKEDVSEFQKNFVNSCVLGSGISDEALIPKITEVCGCTYTNIIKSHGIAEFIRVDTEMRKDPNKGIPKEWNIDAIVEQCVTSLEG